MDAGAPDEGASAEGAWLELSVTADHEAVEAVSEILSRFAPGGTTVEPAFELVDEGLGATGRRRPAGDRPGLSPGPRSGRGPRPRSTAPRPPSATSRRSACGRSASSRRGSSTRRTGRTPGRPTSRSCGSVGGWSSGRPGAAIAERPDDVVIALDPGMAFGTGLHPTTRLCLAGIEAWADAGLFERGSAGHGGSRVLDVGCGSGILAIAAGAVRGRGAGRARHRSDRDRGDAGERPAEPARPTAPARATGSLPSGEPAVRPRPGQPHRLGPRRPGRRRWRRELRPGGRLLASGIFVDREAEVRAAFAAAGLASRDVDRGRLGRARGAPTDRVAAADGAVRRRPTDRRSRRAPVQSGRAPALRDRPADPHRPGDRALPPGAAPPVRAPDRPAGDRVDEPVRPVPALDASRAAASASGSA